MDIRISPYTLEGKTAAITSKSDAHRCLIYAALCSGPTDVVINDSNRDIEATVGCLSALGAEISHPARGVFRVNGIREFPDRPLLDCGESGSTLRFLLPLAAAAGKNARIVGSGRLPQRPLSPLTEQMERHGCRFSSHCLPMELSGKLVSGRYELPGNVSSQYITGLLTVLPFMEGDSEIVLTTPLESAGYVEMTIRTLSLFGIVIDAMPNGGGYRIKGGQQCVSPKRIIAEGDWSNAAFWLAAGALGGETEVCGLDFESVQGDKAIVELLCRFGARAERHDQSFCIAHAPMKGIEIDVSAIPDLVPVLAVTACAARGETVIKNAARLRIKESDRLESVSEMLTSLGGEVTMLQDGLVIHGKGRLRGGRTDSFNDHRIAMAAAVASVICDGEVVITNAQAVEKSYPRFFEDFNSLGGDAHVI